MASWFEYGGVGFNVVYVRCKQINQNAYENYSDIKVECAYYSGDPERVGKPALGWVVGSIGNIDINTRNEAIDFTVATYQTTVAEFTVRIYHNEDGTVTVPINLVIYCRVNNESSWNGYSVKGDFVLDPNPRGSNITSADNVILGNACRIVFTPLASTTYYSLTFSINDWSVTTNLFCPGTTNEYIYDSYIISGTQVDINGNTIYGQLPNSTTGIMTATLTTYLENDETTAFSARSKTFTVSIPDDVKPTIGQIVLTPQEYNLLLQNNNSIKISALDCIPGEGSNIATYSYSGPNVSAITTQSSMVSGRILSIGTLKYTVTVTDTRGRITSESSTIECLPYLHPSITFNAFRSNYQGISDNNGRYITCNYTPKFSSVKNLDGEELNGVDVQIYYSNKEIVKYTDKLHHDTTSSHTEILDSIDLITYDVYATITDNFGGTYTSNIVTIFSKRILNILKNGNGIAFGKMADTEELLDSAWAIRTDKPEQTMQNLTYRNTNLITNTEIDINDTPKNWCAHGNLATTLYEQADKIIDQPSDQGFLLNITNGPNAADVHQVWAGKSNGSLAHRDGNSTGWNGSWKTVLDSKNYADYVDNDYINTMSISWDKIIGTPTTLDGYGIVIEEDNSDKPIVLYDSTEGTQGTIELSESVDSFSYVEIYYCAVDNKQPHSIKICNPHDASITLSCVAPSDFVGFSDSSVAIMANSWLLSNDTLVPYDYSVYCVVPNGRTGTDNNIKIMRILGYK